MPATFYRQGERQTKKIRTWSMVSAARASSIEAAQMATITLLRPERWLLCTSTVEPYSPCTPHTNRNTHTHKCESPKCLSFPSTLQLTKCDCPPGLQHTRSANRNHRYFMSCVSGKEIAIVCSVFLWQQKKVRRSILHSKNCTESSSQQNSHRSLAPSYRQPT